MIHVKSVTNTRLIQVKLAKPINTSKILPFHVKNVSTYNRKCELIRVYFKKVLNNVFLSLTPIMTRSVGRQLTAVLFQRQ